MTSLQKEHRPILAAMASLRGATYRRISLDMAGDAAGVARQAEDIDALVRARGIRVSDQHRYVDNDISAYKGASREGFDRLMAAVRAGDIDVIVVTYLNRLLRNRRERLEVYEELRQRGVSVLCVKGPEIDLTTASGRLVAGVLGEVDSFEVEQLIERSQRRALADARGGVVPKGRRAFGYDPSGEIIGREARWVKDAYRELLAGATLLGIAEGLNKRQVPTVQGGVWSKQGVRFLLLNARYAGLREFRGELYPGTWKAIVDEATWRQACAVLNNPGRRTAPWPGRRHLLSDIALCGVCGASVRAGVRQRRGKQTANTRLYNCRATPHLARTAAPIDLLVEKSVLALLSRPEAADLLRDDTRPDYEALQDKAAALRDRLDGLAEAYADDDAADPRELRVAAQRLRERIAEVEAKMAHPQRAGILGDLVTAHDPEQLWHSEEFTLDRKRAVVGSLWEITILPGAPGRKAFDPESVKIVPR